MKSHHLRCHQTTSLSDNLTTDTHAKKISNVNRVSVDIYDYIEKSLRPQFADQLPTYLCIHDLNKHLVYGNRPAMEVLGFQHEERFTHTCYANLPSQVASDHDIFEQQDEKVFATQDNYRFLSYHCYADSTWKVVLGEKSPLYDDENNLIGLVSNWHDVTQSRFIDLGGMLIAHRFKSGKAKQFSFSIQDYNEAEISLTKRQSETLFYVLRGFGRSDIAQLLGVSARTIETYIEQIKNRFGCDTRKELVEKAITLGYHTMLPQSLLTM